MGFLDKSRRQGCSRGRGLGLGPLALRGAFRLALEVVAPSRAQSLAPLAARLAKENAFELARPLRLPAFLATLCCSVLDALGKQNFSEPCLGRFQHGLLVLGEFECMELDLEHYILVCWLGREVVLDHVVPVEELPVGDWGHVVWSIRDNLVALLLELVRDASARLGGETPGLVACHEL